MKSSPRQIVSKGSVAQNNEIQALIYVKAMGKQASLDKH
jgi:hypothetical protein